MCTCVHGVRVHKKQAAAKHFYQVDTGFSVIVGLCIACWYFDAWTAERGLEPSVEMLGVLDFPNGVGNVSMVAQSFGSICSSCQNHI